MSAELEREISCHYKGLQRQVATAISQSRGQIKVGKDPMPISLYNEVATAMLQSNSRDMMFAKMFMILSWNLMSRAANTREYALCVYFAHMKNDQRGVRPRDSRHVYANPIVPAICPILALDPTDAHISNVVAHMQMTLGLMPCGKERRLFAHHGQLLVRRLLRPTFVLDGQWVVSRIDTDDTMMLVICLSVEPLLDFPFYNQSLLFSLHISLPMVNKYKKQNPFAFQASQAVLVTLQSLLWHH
ncbi:hypothetical protein PHMEG_00036583, partial [Phytophthora megakarya]